MFSWLPLLHRLTDALSDFFKASAGLRSTVVLQ